MGKCAGTRHTSHCISEAVPAVDGDARNAWTIVPIANMRALLLRNYRQHKRRRMLGIVKNRVRGGNKPVPQSDFFAGIEIAIESREVAAGDFQSKRMPAKEYIAGR